MDTDELERFREGQQRQVLLWRGVVIGFMLMNQTFLVFATRSSLGGAMRDAAFTFTMLFVYTNLSTVRYSVSELLEEPVALRCPEFVWLWMAWYVASFFV